GITPYLINWKRLSDNVSIGSRTTISNLSPDNYQVTITDAYGCTATGIYEITQPDIVVETIVPPSCWDRTNGSISVLVNKGDGNFTYDWNTGETTSTITDLSAGSYTVTIDGFGDGPMTRTYTVEAPPPLLIDLEENRTLCVGQELILDASVEDGTATYSWTSDAGFAGNDPKLLINVGGNYTVTVTSHKGCKTMASVFVERSDDQINAEFAISSQAFIGESIIAVDISFPLPETQEWILPAGATVVKQDSDEAELIFHEAGEYEIGIVVKIGNCTSQQTKKVLVMANDGATTNNEHNGSRKHIQDFILHPNPTNGQFVADILLPEKGSIGIQIFNFANNALMASEKASDAAAYS